LVNYSQLLILGAFAGLTIFLGLPIAVLQGLSSKAKGFFNAFAIGILIFLIIDVFSHAWQSALDTTFSAFVGKSPMIDGATDLLAMFGGLALGLLGLTWYGCRYMSDTPQPIPAGSRVRSSSSGNQKRELQLLQQVSSYRLSMMIAIGIGAHNLSEGLAIGQSYASGSLGLALMLIIGFAAHNATEGFGIAAPLTGLSKRPSNRFILLAGLIGGGPTFIGTLLGFAFGLHLLPQPSWGRVDLCHHVDVQFGKKASHVRHSNARHLCRVNGGIHIRPSSQPRWSLAEAPANSAFSSDSIDVI